jgi:hypothetical protein
MPEGMKKSKYGSLDNCGYESRIQVLFGKRLKGFRVYLLFD